MAQRNALDCQGLAELFRRTPDIQLLGAVTKPAEFLSLCEETYPDVAVIDAGFPDDAAFSLSSELMLKKWARRILFLDKQISVVRADRVFGLVGACYFSKQSSFADLYHGIRKLHAGETPLDPLLERDFIFHPTQGRIKVRVDGPSILKLTKRELEVLKLLAKGNSVRGVAHQLRIAESTADNHKARLILDFPDVWTHGHVSVRYEEMALRQEQAEYAAQLIQHAATLTMAVAVKDAIEAVVPALPDAVRRDGNRILQIVDDAIANSASKPWTVGEDQVAKAYHISRLIRNAYAHAPFAPQWMINRHIQDTTFAIPNVIELRTRGLHGNDLDWRHYGGLLALYQLCRFTRFDILGDERRVRTNIPPRQRTLYQLGDLIMERIDEVPEGYEPVSVEPNADGSIDLGHGYHIRPARSENADEQSGEPERLYFRRFNR